MTIKTTAKILLIITMISLAYANPFRPTPIRPLPPESVIGTPSSLEVSDTNVRDIDSIFVSWSAVDDVQFYSIENQNRVSGYRGRERWSSWAVFGLVRAPSAEVGFEGSTKNRTIRYRVRACKFTTGTSYDLIIKGRKLKCGEYSEVSEEVFVKSTMHPCDLPPHCEEILPPTGGGSKVIGSGQP